MKGNYGSSKVKKYTSKTPRPSAKAAYESFGPNGRKWERDDNTRAVHSRNRGSGKPK